MVTILTYNFWGNGILQYWMLEDINSPDTLFEPGAKPFGVNMGG